MAQSTRLFAEGLAQGLKQVLPAIALKPSCPILANVLIRAIPGTGLQLTAFDLKIGIQTIVSADPIDEAWDFTIPGKLLYDIVKQFPEWTEIELAVAGDSLKLQSGTSTYKLCGMAADEYPALPTPGQEILVNLAPKELLKVVRSLLPVVSTKHFGDEPLGNIFVRFNPGEVRFYASDGHRIATQAISTPELQESGEAILSTEFLKTVRQYEGYSAIALGLAGEFAYLEVGQTRIVSRVVKGKFPVDALDLHLNKPRLQATVIEVKPLKKAVERIAKLTNKGDPIRLRADRKESALIISSGENQEIIHAQVKQSSQARLNPAYLLDALKSISTAEALLTLDCCALNRIEPLGGNDLTHLIVAISPNVAGTWKDGVYTSSDRRVVISPPVGDLAIAKEDGIDSPEPVIEVVEIATAEPQPLEQLPEPLETDEAVEQLRKQLREVLTLMTDYVISQEEMQEAIVGSLRPDQAYEIACGHAQMIPYGEDLSKWIGRHIVIHTSPVDGELLESTEHGLRRMELEPNDAPMNHVLGYGIIADVKHYTSETWDKDFYDNVHRYADPLSAIALSSPSGEVYGVMIRRPMFLADPVELKAQVLHEFWEPNSPAYTAAIRQVFDVDRRVVDVEKEVYPDLVEAE